MASASALDRRPKTSIILDHGTPAQRVARVVMADEPEQLRRGVRIVHAQHPDATVSLVAHDQPKLVAHVTSFEEYAA